MDAIKEVSSNPIDPATLILEFQIHRVPFFLEPDMSADESITEMHMERMFRKFGRPRGMDYDDFLTSWEVIKAPHALAPRGKEVGIEFNESRIVSSTMNSHRLIRWVAQHKGLASSEALYDVLNRRHFVEGRKLNDVEMLLECIQEVEANLRVGLDSAEAKQFLESSLGEVEVRQIVSKVHSMGIHSIPAFVFDAEFMVSGAQHSRELISVMRKIEKNCLAELSKQAQQQQVFTQVKDTIFASAVEDSVL